MTREDDGPVAQSIGLGFRALTLAILGMSAWWATSNCRPVPPDLQAVVMRFGRIVRTQPAGLVAAWPRPIETVALLPGPDRQMALKVVAESQRGLDDAYARATGQVLPPGAGAFLTGDGAVAVLDTTLTWRIADPAAYVLAADHVAPALRRLYLASAVALAAGRDLDQFLVARPERGGASPEAQARRASLRTDLARQINRRLAELAASGSPLGIEVTRVDAAALLPPAAKQAFDSVLDAGQMADQGLAAARTDAERAAQGAAREQDRLLAEAHALAEERLARASEATAGITALEARMTPESRPGLLDQVRRARIVAVLRAAGAVTAVDAAAGRVILQGPPPP